MKGFRDGNANIFRRSKKRGDLAIAQSSWSAYFVFITSQIKAAAAIANVPMDAKPIRAAKPKNRLATERSLTAIATSSPAPIAKVTPNVKKNAVFIDFWGWLVVKGL